MKERVMRSIPLVSVSGGSHCCMCLSPADFSAFQALRATRDLDAGTGVYGQQWASIKEVLSSSSPWWSAASMDV